MRKKLPEQTIIRSQLSYYRIVAKFPSGVLAKRVGISRSNLYKIEQGLVIPSIATVLKLSKVLQVSVDDLFSLEEIDEQELDNRLSDYYARLIGKKFTFKKRSLIRSLFIR